MGMMSMLIFSVIFGSIGFGYIVYGRKQQKPIPLVVGLCLCAFPYFIPDPYAMATVGTILTITPWLLRER